MKFVLAASLAATALLSGLLGPASATGAESPGPWSLPGKTISSADSQGTSRPEIAVGGNGDVVSIWRSLDGSHDRVQAAIRRPGKDFGAAVNLSPAGFDSGQQAVAVGPDGTAIAAWSLYRADDSLIQVAIRPAGGTFGSPVSLSAPGGHARDPQVAIGPDGSARVVWARAGQESYVVQVAERPSPDDSSAPSFQTPFDLSDGDFDATNPQISIAGNRDAVVVWQASDGTDSAVQAATYAAQYGWIDMSDVSSWSGSAEDPVVVAGADGAETVAWRDSALGKGVVFASVRTADGGLGFGTPVALSESDTDSFEPEIAADPDGRVTVVWDDYDGTNSHVMEATREPGQGFGPSEQLSPVEGHTTGPSVAFGSDGSTMVAWSRNPGGVGYAVQTLTRSPGGDFDAPVNLTPPSGSADSQVIAIGPAGVATAVWRYSDGRGFQKIQAAMTEVTTPADPLTPDPPVDPDPPITPVTPVTPAGKASLEIKKTTPRRLRLKKGGKVKVRVQARNGGDATALGVRICISGPKNLKRILKYQGPRCRPVGALAPDTVGAATVRIRATARIRKGRTYVLRVKVTAEGVAAATRQLRVRGS